MYKKQLGFQRIVCILAIVAAALWFVYSLGVITDVYEALGSAIRDPNKLDVTRVDGAILFYDMQDFNDDLCIAGIGLILLSCLLFITNTHSRRRYYIGNFFAVGVYSVASIAMFAWAHKYLAAYAHQFKTTVNFEQLEAWAKIRKFEYTTSTWLLDFHLVLGVISVLVVLALIGNCIWKVALMRGEQALIDAGKEAE